MKITDWVIKAPQYLLNKWQGFSFFPNTGLAAAQPHPWEGQQAFVEKLINVQTYISARHSNQPSPNVSVDLSLRNSTCPYCGKKGGIHSFIYGMFWWPDDCAHYIRDHNVVPDEAFKQFILDFVWTFEKAPTMQTHIYAGVNPAALPSDDAKMALTTMFQQILLAKGITSEELLKLLKVWATKAQNLGFAMRNRALAESLHAELMTDKAMTWKIFCIGLEVIGLNDFAVQVTTR